MPKVKTERLCSSPYPRTHTPIPHSAIQPSPGILSYRPSPALIDLLMRYAYSDTPITSVSITPKPSGRARLTDHTKASFSTSHRPPTMKSETCLTEACTNQQPLYFFYDCETTGLSPLITDIIEMAATVAHPNGKRNTFSKLISTDQRISGAACCIHGIRNDDIEDEPPFPEVFESFCKWLTKQTEVISAENGAEFYPVLVAHNGHSFDYRILLSLIEKHKLDGSWFEKHNVKFVDSLQYLRQVKKQGDPLLDDQRLTLESLHQNFFPNEEYQGHRALPDAENLKRLFTKPPLNSLLASMPAISYDQQVKNYEMAHDKKMMEMAYAIKPYQAKRLAECGFTKERLEELYKTKYAGFDTTLHKNGVNSKPLREKILFTLGAFK